MLRKTIIQTGMALLVAIAVFRFFFTPLKPDSAEAPPFLMRVRIAHDETKLELGKGDRYEVRDAETGDLLERELEIRSDTGVSSVSTGIRLGGRIFTAPRIRVSPLRDRGITLNGTTYRGRMDIIRTAGGLDAVNRVELEDYLRGVLPREVHHLWPFEVIKAQAIASRSFAVHEALRWKNRTYDLTADTFSQVYGGESGERWRTSRAVEATRGKVLEYEGRILPGYFHSCCGGYTQNTARIWGKGMPPLRGVKCSWCQWSPYFRWRVRVATRTILKRISSKGYRIERIDDIREGIRDVSGRLEYIRVRSCNKWFEITTKDFRSAIGGKILKSANFHIKKYPLFYLFSGYGWGHGAGMCQWGAFGLSLRRWNTERILKQYYPGAEIVDMRQVL